MLRACCARDRTRVPPLATASDPRCARSHLLLLLDKGPFDVYDESLDRHAYQRPSTSHIAFAACVPWPRPLLPSFSRQLPASVARCARISRTLDESPKGTCLVVSRRTPRSCTCTCKDEFAVPVRASPYILVYPGVRKKMAAKMAAASCSLLSFGSKFCDWNRRSCETSSRTGTRAALYRTAYIHRAEKRWSFRRDG